MGRRNSSCRMLSRREICSCVRLYRLSLARDVNKNRFAQGDTETLITLRKLRDVPRQQLLFVLCQNKSHNDYM